MKISLQKVLLAVVLVLLLFAAACGGDVNDADGEDAVNEGEVANANADNSEGDSDYPNKPITLIVPYAAGGTTDTAARALTSVISDYLPNNESMVVVNREGGAGVIGMTELVNSDPDGYTLALASSGPMTIAPHIQDTDYDIESFEYITRVVTTPNILLVRNDSPWETYEDFVEYVKEHPGEVTYGTSGEGNSQHISMEAFLRETGLEMTHIPYEGGAPVITALLGGHIDVGVNQSVEGIPHLESGEIRALVNTGSYAPKGLEDVPLLRDKGIDVGLDVWNAIVAPAGLSEDKKQILIDAFEQALQDERVIEQFDNLGIEPGFAPADEMKEIMVETYETHGTVLKNAGIID